MLWIIRSEMSESNPCQTSNILPKAIGNFCERGLIDYASAEVSVDTSIPNLTHCRQASTLFRNLLVMLPTVGKSGAKPWSPPRKLEGLLTRDEKDSKIVLRGPGSFSSSSTPGHLAEAAATPLIANKTER